MSTGSAALSAAALAAIRATDTAPVASVTPGSWAIVRGLKGKPELNGRRVCVVAAPKEGSDRYRVCLEPKEETAASGPLGLRAANLRPVRFHLPGFDVEDMQSGSRSLMLGRTPLSNDMISLVLERCRIEVSKSRRRWPTLGCVVCGSHDSLRLCEGCGLTQWCSEACRRSDLRAGHETACTVLHSLNSLYTIPEVQRLAQLKRTRGGEEEYGALMFDAMKKYKLGEAGFFLLANLAMWPASSARGTRPGKRLAGNANELQRAKFFLSEPERPGKLTCCAESHKARFSKLSKAQLKAKHVLPCGAMEGAAATMGVPTRETRHPPVFATLKSLTRRKEQKTHCQMCNSGGDVFYTAQRKAGAAPQKMALSDCFYSFCFDRVVNRVKEPGGIQHCRFCGFCRDYMYGHCADCGVCSYGHYQGTMPCAECHDMILFHDGIGFVPTKKDACREGVAGNMVMMMMTCRCDNGKSVWFDRDPKGRPKPAHYRRSPGSWAAAAAATEREFGDVTSAVYDKKFAEARTDPIVKMQLLDMVLSIVAPDMKAKRELLESCDAAGAGKARLCARIREEVNTDVASAGGLGAQMCQGYIDRFRTLYERKATSKGEPKLEFVPWLERELCRAERKARKELAAHRAECEKTGAPLDRERFEAFLARTCGACGAKETAERSLRTCSRCHKAWYCDQECQTKAWAVHKLVCRTKAGDDDHHDRKKRKKIRGGRR